jgi:hypothetical protein
MTSLQNLILKFEKMGAGATIRHMTKQMLRQYGTPFVIDVRTNDEGEYFDILKTKSVKLRVLDSTARHRHLLLSAAQGSDEDRFLCGHDEQHWFVAGLPEQADASSVRAAMESLKPTLVRSLEDRKPRKRRRTGDVYLRQGEWFFVPCPHASIEPGRIQRRRPLVRGPGSNPHMCEFMYLDGEREYECDRYPKLAFFESEYREIVKARRKAKQWGWRQLPYDPDIYVRGSVSHPDHATIYLDCWHRVELSRESQSRSLRRPVLTTIRYRD